MTDCSSSPVSTVYLGHDNTVTIVPYEDINQRDYLDMSAVITVTGSMDLTSSATTGDDITASSADAPVTIWWEQVGTTDEWRIHFKCGLFVGVAPGSYKLRVVVIEPNYPNGLVLSDAILVDVIDVP